METWEQRAEDFSRWIYSAPLEAAGKSIRQHAKDLGVQPKTYAGWMDATDNTSYIWQANKSFDILGINPLYYYGVVLHPEMAGVNDNPPIDQKREALRLFVSDTLEEEVQLLHWLHFGDHGASWERLLQVCIADTHLPMDDRVKSTKHLCQLYRYAQENGQLMGNPVIQPNAALVESATAIGHRAVIGGASGYVAIPSDQEYYKGRIGRLLQFCREKSGYSKETIAGLNRCRVETISNYEAEISYPNFFKLKELLSSMGMPVFQLLYNEMYPAEINIQAIGTTSRERAELMHCAATEPEQMIDWVTFLILGQHGGSWHCYLHKMAMFASLPPQLRTGFANFATTSYEMAQAMGRVVCPDQADPQIDDLRLYYGK